MRSKVEARITWLERKAAEDPSGDWATELASEREKLRAIGLALPKPSPGCPRAVPAMFVGRTFLDAATQTLALSFRLDGDGRALLLLDVESARLLRDMLVEAELPAKAAR